MGPESAGVRLEIAVSGLPETLVSKAEAEIRATLALREAAGELHVVAAKLPNGTWITFVFDAVSGAEVLVPGLAERLSAQIF